MIAFVLRRLLAAIPTIFGIALVVFCLFNWVGGDPTLIMMGKHGNEAVRQELRQELGLDKPLPAQFVDYLGQIVTFDFGRSYATRREISDMILDGMGPSFALGFPALLITTILGLALALVASKHRATWVDRLLSLFSIVGLSLPTLALILFGQYFLAYRLGWFPISGFDWRFPDVAGYLALPVLISVGTSLGYEFRIYRTAVLDEAYQEYTRTARAKGLSESKVWGKHVLKNTMIPVITNVIVEIPQLILGSLLLETFFGIPGLGYIMVSALNNSDFPVIRAMTTVVSLLLVFGMIVTDVLYALVDPRVKFK
jgi:peptide/nickel transport system permease protein